VGWVDVDWPGGLRVLDFALGGAEDFGAVEEMFDIVVVVGGEEEVHKPRGSVLQ